MIKSETMRSLKGAAKSAGLTDADLCRETGIPKGTWRAYLACRVLLDVDRVAAVLSVIRAHGAARGVECELGLEDLPWQVTVTHRPIREVAP